MWVKQLKPVGDKGPGQGEAERDGLACLAVKGLRSHVLDGSPGVGEEVTLARIGDVLAEAKINDFGPSRGIQEDVLRLQIAVHHICRVVEVSKALCHIVCNPQDLQQVQWRPELVVDPLVKKSREATEYACLCGAGKLRMLARGLNAFEAHAGTLEREMCLQS